MIRHIVSVVLLVRNGFTGVPMPPGSVLVLLVDGRRCSVVRKPGGWLILTNLPEGKHELSLRCVGFHEEVLTVEVRSGAVWEQAVDLRPGPGYWFPPGTTHLTATVKTSAGRPAKGVELWAGKSGQTRVTVSQAKAEQREAQLFCRGPIVRLPVPGNFLFVGGSAPELVYLRKLRASGEASLEKPLNADRKRGEELFPVRRFRTGEDGTAELSFPGGGELWLYCEGQVRSVALEKEREALELVLEKKAQKTSKASKSK